MGNRFFIYKVIFYRKCGLGKDGNDVELGKEFFVFFIKFEGNGIISSYLIFF